MTTPNWLKEPLVHFLLAGGALFALSAWLNPVPPAQDEIVIGREEVRALLEARAQLYDAETFDALLDDMTPEERAALVREAAIAEMLWREGQAIGLTERDPVVRQRVVQQMRQLAMEDAAAEVSLTDAEVEAFFESNRARYASDALVSFSHVFVRDGEARAEALLGQLREDVDAAAMGDRFLYQRNYASASRGEISSQFGGEFAEALFALEPGGWQGPLASEHGWHLVLLREMSAAAVPDFAEIEAQVREDAEAEARALAANDALEDLFTRYSVQTRDDIAP